MSRWQLVPLEPPAAAPRAISDRLYSQLIYFADPSAPNVPGEFRFSASDVSTWLDEGVLRLVSPLDTANMTEVELSEEQESFLSWLDREGVRHVRVQQVR